MKRWIRSASFALAVLGIAAVASANFVDNGGALPAHKTDRFPPTNLGQQWTAADANAVIDALADLRTVAQRAPISVKAFGAKGDGVTDDSAAIQAALTAAATSVAGKFTTGLVATGCTITFATAFTNVPTCTVTGPGVAVPTYSESATAITMTLDVASTTYRYNCVGLNE